MNFVPGPMELGVILVIVMMLFGVGKLPEVFGAAGKGIRNFRREVSMANDSATNDSADLKHKPTGKVATNAAIDV